MKLLGRDISGRRVLAKVEARLRERGLTASVAEPPSPEGVEPRVEPLTFNLNALATNADATVALPLETHRAGMGGRAVVLGKSLFRRVAQPFINEALGRQRVFNGHVRDSYAELSAELMRLRARVAELEAERVQEEPPPPPLARSAPRRTGARAASIREGLK